MPLYIREFLGDTLRLSAEEIGVYALLIMDYWLAGPPPDDDKQLAAVARLPLKAWRKMRPTIEEYFNVTEGEWRHKRVEEELAEARRLYEIRSTSGQKGGRPKKQNESPALANGKPGNTQVHSTLTEVSNETSSRDAAVDDELRKWLSDNSLSVDPVAELAKFSDWKLANARKFKNDRAAFRNWLRKAAEINAAKPSGQIAYTAKPGSYVEPWSQRMAGYRKNGFWRDEWGFRPNQPGNNVPDEFLTPEERAIKHRKDAA
jgi:uncharacterized protein YdaU (DUF1376 family)